MHVNVEKKEAETLSLEPLSRKARDGVRGR